MILDGYLKKHIYSDLGISLICISIYEFISANTKFYYYGIWEYSLAILIPNNPTPTPHRVQQQQHAIIGART